MELFKTKQLSKCLIVINILVIGFLLSSLITFNVNAESENDLNYNFKRDVLFNQDNESYYQDFNTKEYVSYMPDGIYNATYTFTDIPDGTKDDDIDFVDQVVSDVNTTVQIVSEIDGHNKVLELFDNSSSDMCEVYNYFNFAQSSGIYEMWFYITDASYQGYSYLYDGNIPITDIFVSSNQLWYYDGDTYSIASISDNTWYHLKVDFDCSSNTYDIYLDEDLIQDNANFLNNADSVNKLRLRTDSTPLGYYFYVDAIGYDWQGYSTNYINDLDFTYGSHLSGTYPDSYYNDTDWFTVRSGAGGDSGDLWVEFLFDNETILDWFCISYYIELPLLTTGTLLLYINEEIYDSNGGVDMYISADILQIDYPVYSIILYCEHYQVYNVYVNFFSLKFRDLDDKYDVGDNLECNEIEDKRFLEPDKWEFSHDSLFDRLDDGQDNPNGWTDLEDGEDDVNCRMYDDYDGVVELYANSGDYIGLYKDDFTYTTDEIYTFSFGFEIKYIYSILNNDIYLKIYSSDATEIIRIRINNNGTDTYLKYWVSGYDYVLLTDGFIINTNYSIDLEINYDTDKCLLEYYTNGVYTDDFEFPLIASGKTGLKQVNFDACADTDYVQVYLDYIGIYVNDRPITTDFGSIGVHVCDHSYWYFTEYNLLAVDIIGEGISIYLDVAGYVISVPNFVHQLLVSSDDYTGLTRFNLYDYLYDDYWGYPYIWGGVLWFHFYNTFEFNEVNLEGVKLVEGENEYPLEFDSSGVDVNNSFFYVENDKLYFTITHDDEDLEYIKATFNVENIGGVNRSITYKSLLTGNALGYLKIYYDDDSYSSCSLRTYVHTPNIILPQEKTIDEFGVLITDEDKDVVQGTTTGYIEYITLIFIPDISISITVQTLIAIMIPIMIMLVPTLLFYMKFGKNAIIPSFLLMSFICFITDLIPIWLFFIIAIACGSFMLIRKTSTRGE